MAFPAVKRTHDFRGSAPFPQSGTKAAVYRYSKSDAAFERKPERTGWGGARNRGDRTNGVVTAKQAAGIIAAARHALAIGLPLNRHVTIHWERAGVPDDRAAEATGRFLKLTSDWLATKGALVAHIWVRENGPRKGSHVHILLHLPAGRSLGPMQRGWLKRITGGPYRKSVIVTKRIGGTANAATTNPDAYVLNLANVVGYVLKGINPTAAEALGLALIEPGGLIIGKRTATSQNIGAGSIARSLK